MESTFWNQLDVKQPPNLTCKLNSTDVSLSNLRKISDVCWNALTTLKNQDLLISETAILSRLIFRMKRMFRGDKGFKSLQKINQCLRHFMTLNLIPMYDNFFHTIPWDCSENDIYCPTLQMLEYVLLRTQGLSALLCRIVHTCHEAAFFLRSRISSGHNWQVSLLCLGVVGRIWSMAKHILHSCMDWYSTMLPFTRIFKPIGPSWLPNGYVFPQDLLAWLSLPWINHELPETSSSSFVVQVQQEKNLCVKSSNNTLLSVNQFCPRAAASHHSICDDVGVSIDRSSIDVASTTLRRVESSGTTDEEKEGVSEIDTLKRNHSNSRNTRRERKVNLSKSANHNKDFVNLCEVVKNQHPDLLQDQKSLVSEESSAKLSKKAKNTNVLSLLKSEVDVQSLIKNESKKRTLTSSLDDKQWGLLKGILCKLSKKLQKAPSEKKKKQVISQIQKAFEIALC